MSDEWRNETPTIAQINAIGNMQRELQKKNKDYKWIDSPKTKGEASDLIGQLKEALGLPDGKNTFVKWWDVMEDYKQFKGGNGISADELYMLNYLKERYFLTKKVVKEKPEQPTKVDDIVPSTTDDDNPF